jgi:hypothetical protein
MMMDGQLGLLFIGVNSMTSYLTSMLPYHVGKPWLSPLIQYLLSITNPLLTDTPSHTPWGIVLLPHLPIFTLLRPQYPVSSIQFPISGWNPGRGIGDGVELVDGVCGWTAVNFGRLSVGSGLQMEPLR